ncbi:hypothetical protein [Xanthomonas axonopodis]|uniref:hypothetical protein n=1 Tax=Xanthomonas axonopodis TaxID=53413 RepID=UPI001FD57FA1|nr:hypothetical protein [Xanthomonas axonopodis]
MLRDQQKGGLLVIAERAAGERHSRGHDGMVLSALSFAILALLKTVGRMVCLLMVSAAT